MDIKKLDSKIKFVEMQNTQVISNFSEIQDTVVKLTIKE